MNRITTTQIHQNSLSTIIKRQQELAGQQERVSLGKNLIKASDDPISAAQSERATNRFLKLATYERNLKYQKATIETASSTLDNIMSALGELRELTLKAGNGSYSKEEREALTLQMKSLKEQISQEANRTDANGLPLFRGLDTKSKIPFPDNGRGVNGGQKTNDFYEISNSLDGIATFFNGKTGNGILETKANLNNKGNCYSDPGIIINPKIASSLDSEIKISFSKNEKNEIIYKISGGVDDGKTGIFKENSSIEVQGIKLNFKGNPDTGDSFIINSSKEQSIFEAIDNCIEAVLNENQNKSIMQDLLKSINELDTVTSCVSTTRSLAGDLLNQADKLSQILQFRKDEAINDKANSEGSTPEKQFELVAQLKLKQTALEVALQSYASISRVSLMDFIR